MYAPLQAALVPVRRPVSLDALKRPLAAEDNDPTPDAEKHLFAGLERSGLSDFIVGNVAHVWRGVGRDEVFERRR